MVVGIIASAIGVPDRTITAAVFGFDHPAGNGAGIWVFRATGITSAVAIERWVATMGRCAGPPQSVLLAGRPTTVILGKVVDQCQPEYLVALDDETVAQIIDDGGYHGNSSYPVPYRPQSDIAQLVVWLQQNLPSTPLMTGGPNPRNGP